MANATIKDLTIHVYDVASQAFVKAFPRTETKQVVDWATAVASALAPYMKTEDVNTALAKKLDATATATKATADASGNVITTTYATKDENAANLATAKKYTDDMKDSLTGGTFVSKKAEQDGLGNVISDTYATKTEVSTIPKFAISVVDKLPTADISNTTIYLVKTGSDTNNLYTEYIYVNSKWEELGTQALDLSGYLKKEDAEKTYQKVLTFDDAPTDSSANPVKSGGVKTYVDSAVTTHNSATTAHQNLLQVSTSATTPTGMANNGLWFEITGDSTVTDV